MSKYSNKKALISIMVAMVMVLSAFLVITPNASATPTTNQLPVGTVTLNPSSGAFPGQLVTYTWSGVPTNLVPPVYVTVYINGAPYSTGVATYSNGVLTGTFTMPNAQPGTVFNVALSYTDSAHNYGTSAQISSSGTVNAYVAPTKAYSYANTSIGVNFGVPYTLMANVNYTSPQNVKTNFTGGSGILKGYTNSIFNASSSNILLKTNSSTSATLKLATEFGGLVNFSSSNSKQNITVNTTAYNGGLASLSLPASNPFNSIFYFSGNNITKIVLYGDISETINGQSVLFNLTGTYIGSINTTGYYTLLGSVVAKTPSPLNTSFSGSFSASYDIVNYSYAIVNSTYASYRYYINYTLSLTIKGQTPDGVVKLNAQYLNTTIVKGMSAVNSSVIQSSDILTVQSGYSFTSNYVDLQNPGISGTFVNNFTYTQLYTGNLTFSFSNFKFASLSSTFVWYDNMTSIAIHLNNQTLRGFLNITVNTSSYSPGVQYISPAVWEFSTTMKLFLNNTVGLKITGNSPLTNSPLTNNTYYYNETVLTSYAKTFELPMITNFYDMLGYPYLNEFNVSFTPFTLNYSDMNELSVVQQNFTWTGNVNLTTLGTAINGWGVNSTILGFNFTFSNNTIKLWVNVSSSLPVMYGFSDTGSVAVWVALSGLLSKGSYVNETYTGNFTPEPATFKVVNQYNYVSNETLTNLTFATYSIMEIYGTVIDAAITNGSVTFTSPLYLGSIGITGKSNGSLTPSLGLTPNSSSNISGKITSVSGFGNTTVLGWYNTTLTVREVHPALYGLSAMKGVAVVWANVSIMNVSHSLTVDPYYAGLQNVTLIVPILLNTNVSQNETFSARDDSQNLTIVGIGYKGYLNNLKLSGTMSITNPIYNLTDNIAFTLEATVPFFQSSSNLSLSSYKLSGDVPISNISFNKSVFNVSVDSPIVNLTLTPLASFNLIGKFTANYSSTYNIDGRFTLQYVTPLTGNNTVLSFSGIVSGNATIEASVQNSYITLQGNVNGITFTTNPIDVLNAGSIPVSGLTTGQYGSGTLTGLVNISKIYPFNGSNSFKPSQVNLSGQLILQGFYANGSQYYVTVDLMNTAAAQSLTMGLTTPVSASFTTTIYTEMQNSGISPSVSYSLLNGSGALIVSISNNQIAQIATLSGQYVNMTLAQLNAKLSSVWSAENSTYALINTNYGNMVMMLNAMNANITSIKNGVATIQTSLGTIQTSLNDLNAKIVSLSGTVATIQTNLGTVQTSLNAINATVTSSASSINGLVGSVATIKTTLGTISGTITSVNNGIATIQTDLGTLQTNVSAIKTASASTSSTVSSTMGWELGVLVLVIITLVLVLIVIMQVSRISKQFKPKEEIKTPEEKKEGQ